MSSSWTGQSYTGIILGRRPVSHAFLCGQNQSMLLVVLLDWPYARTRSLVHEQQHQSTRQHLSVFCSAYSSYCSTTTLFYTRWICYIIRILPSTGINRAWHLAPSKRLWLFLISCLSGSLFHKCQRFVTKKNIIAYLVPRTRYLVALFITIRVWIRRNT